MKLLMDAIHLLKKDHYIDSFNIYDEDIYHDGAWHLGKELFIHTLRSRYPMTFPTGVSEILLSRKLKSLAELGWSCVEVSPGSANYYAKLIGPPERDISIKSEGWPGYEEPRGCPDCTDGFYYPFMGEREPCQTCSN